MPKQNGGASRTRNQGGRNGGRGSAQPLPLVATVQVDKVVRFKFAAALAGVVMSDTELLDLLCVATAANAAVQLAAAVRLRGIEMWVDPVAGGSLVSIEDEAQSAGVGGPSRIKEDTTLGVTRPAHIMWRPSPGSLQSMWISAVDGRDLLTFTSSGAGFLDLHVSWILQDGEAPVAVTEAVAGATTGRVYLRSLSGAGAIVPVSFPTI